MNTKLLMTVALLSLVQGCATQQSPGRPSAMTKDAAADPGSVVIAAVPPGVPPCSNSMPNNSDCVIDLKVIDKGTDSCEISLSSPDDDLIPLAPGVQTLIYWRINATPAQYIFTEDDGVVFTDNFRPRNFAKGRRQNGDPTVFIWKNFNRGRKVYSYVINVTNINSTRECFLDPWIRTK